MHEQFSIIWGTRQLKYNQVCLYLASAIKQLKASGVKPLDRVAICDEPRVEYVILLLALWQMKAVAVPISHRWPQKTVSSYAAKLSAKHLFHSGDIKRVVCFDARHPVEPGSVKDFDLEQEVSIVATSGSSGEAKAALHTWGNHYYSARGSSSVIALDTGDRWLLSLPLYHVSGLGTLVRCLLAGAGLVVHHGDDLMASIVRGKVTHVSMVATQLQRLMADEKNLNLLGGLKCILLGGSAIPKALIEASMKAGLNIYLSYGLTETASQVATGKVVSNAKTCIKALPFRELSISAEGEILVRGEVLFKGYVTGSKVHLPLVSNMSSPNASVGDLWFATGDMGQLDHDGCLTVSGRRDSMFISGGENIHPEEIEKALLGIKGVIEVVVVPKEDKEFGSRPLAFIKFDGKGPSEEEIIRHLQICLPRFKIPIAFLPWPRDLITQGIKISRQDFLKIIPRR